MRHVIAFSGLTLLVGRQEEQGASDLHVVQLMSMPPYRVLVH